MYAAVNTIIGARARATSLLRTPIAVEIGLGVPKCGPPSIRMMTMPTSMTAKRIGLTRSHIRMRLKSRLRNQLSRYAQCQTSKALKIFDDKEEFLIDDQIPLNCY